MGDIANIECYRLMSAVTERAKRTVEITTMFYARLKANVGGKNVLLVKNLLKSSKMMCYNITHTKAFLTGSNKKHRIAFFIILKHDIH